MYASSKNRKFIFYILFGSHRYQFKMEVIIGKKLVKKVIIRFYYDSIITLLQKYCKKSGIKLKQKDVAFKFYYKWGINISNFLYILSISVLCVSIGVAIYGRKITRVLAGIMAVCVLFLSYNIINAVTARRNIKIPTETFEQICQIDWNCKEFLDKAGFESDDGKEYFNDKYHMLVTFSAERPNGLSEYKNLQYEFSESTLGALDFQRLYVEEIPTTRSYYVYADDVKIAYFEHSYDEIVYDFESAINEIYQL